MQLTRYYKFNIDLLQDKTLATLRTKYHINVSQFIRDAINEKLERDKGSIFRKYKEVQEYLMKINDNPF